MEKIHYMWLLKKEIKELLRFYCQMNVLKLTKNSFY